MMVVVALNSSKCTHLSRTQLIIVRCAKYSSASHVALQDMLPKVLEVNVALDKRKRKFNR